MLLVIALGIVFLPAAGLCGTFSDDFEDGALGSWWHESDGSITDADEYGGILHLSGPDPEAELLGDIPTVGQWEYFTGDVTVTATFEAVNPTPFTTFGLVLGNGDHTEHAGISVYHDYDPVLNRGTMICFADESVFLSPSYAPATEVDIPDFAPGDIITLQLVKVAGEAAGLYSINDGPFYQIGSTTVTTEDPFTVGIVAMNWPPAELGAAAYDFSVLGFEMSGPAIPNMIAGGGPDTFADDFEDTATYLGDSPTKWRQVGTSSGYFGYSTGSDGGLAVQLIDDNPEFHAPALGAEHAQYYDLSSIVEEVEIRPIGSFGSGGIGFGVYDDSGENLCGGIAAQIWYDTYWWAWVFSLFNLDEYAPEVTTMDYVVMPSSPLDENYFDPTQFHRLRIERLGSTVSATLDEKWVLSGTPTLPIDVAGSGVYTQRDEARDPSNFLFDNFSLNAQPDNRTMVFSDVEIMEDTPADEIFPAWSRDGKLMAYTQDEMDTGDWNVWVKQVDSDLPPVQCTKNEDRAFIFAVPAFSPDYSHVLFTALTPDGRLVIKRVPADGSLGPGSTEVAPIILEAESINYYAYDISPVQNLLVGTKQPEGGHANLFAIGLTEDGLRKDDTVTMITNFSSGPESYDPHFDQSCDKVVFMGISDDSPPLPAKSDIYVLSGVLGILDPLLPDPAPTSYEDPAYERIKKIASSPEFEATGRFSGDGSLVYYCKDVEGGYDLLRMSNNPYLPWTAMMANSHFEIFAVNPDTPEEPFKLNYYRPYAQGVLAASPDGTKLAFVSDKRADGDEVIDADIYVVTLAVREAVDPSQDTEIVDGSGTTLDLPVGSISEPTVITIKTPVPGDIPSPETLPDGLQNIALARIIDAESETATIDPDNPPILTIHHTDEEIAGLDEMSLRIYVFNNEAEPPAWEALENCQVDPVANIVWAPLPHLSVFCVSSAFEGTLPVIGSFKAPLTNQEDFTLQYGTALPVKFDIRSAAGSFLPDEPIEAVVVDPSLNKIATFVRGAGSDDIRVDATTEQYIFNLHSKDYGLEEGLVYTIVILWNNIPIGDIGFTVDYTKGVGRGKK
jgi:hypothetical protein